MIPWFKNVKPHKDIQEGRLDESVFAADLAEVVSGKGRDIYTNAEMFFQKTYFTGALKNIAKRVIQGLNGGQDSQNRVITLQTGFGGGKTHTLISLYHLAKWGKKSCTSPYVKELIEYAGVPMFEEAQIAVFTNNTNDPVKGRRVGDLTIRTIWGELAYQLGGPKTYEMIRVNDEKMVAPKGLFKDVLNKCKPALILIDELADYCISASGVKVEASNLKDQTVSFMQELTVAISGTDHCVMIATLPASAQELGASPALAEILSALESRIDRVGASMRPVEDEEIFEVVRRRLFEDLGSEKEIEEVVSEYSDMYQSYFTEIPGYAVKSEYAEKLRKSYPFHPELIDIFRLRWASNSRFQRTRGVLRILASVVSDLWNRQNSLTGSHFLIHTSDVMLSNLEVITSQITTLNGINWDSVISADVSGNSSNAFRIDNQFESYRKNNLAQGIATTILLGTFGTTGQNKGMGINEIKLSLIKPDGTNHNDINGALDRLEAEAHYLYYSLSGQKRYWYATTPNVNILINQVKANIKEPEIASEILRRLNEKTKSVQIFNVLINPSEDIPEQMKPTLVILSPLHLSSQSEMNLKTRSIIEKIATKKGKAERIFRNTILFLVCSEIGYSNLKENIKSFIAHKKIIDEYNTQLTQEQKSEIRGRIEESGKQADYSIVVAYSILVKYAAKEGISILNIKQFKETLETQITYNIVSALKDNEWLLDSVGLNTLRNNNLLPTLEQPINVKSIYEAFLKFDDKPMITGEEAISKSLLKYCYNGEFCIATGDGKTFTNYYLREEVPFFVVNDASYWIVDSSLKPEKKSPGEQHTSTPSPEIVMSENQESGSHMEADSRKINSIIISGKVAVQDYTELMSSFILPFTPLGYKIDIEIKFKIKANVGNPLDDKRPQYINAKESANQLGLNFEEE